MVFAQQRKQCGESYAETARELGLDESTISRWSHRPDVVGTTDIILLGREAQRADAVQIEEVEHILSTSRPGVGVPAIAKQVPDVPRAELAFLKREYISRLLADVNLMCRLVLLWASPKTILAADFAKLDHPIGGVFKKILVIRDLASRFFVAVAPVVEESKEEVMKTFRNIFMAYGAPLVMKFDNGSVFKNDDVFDLLCTFGVTPLLSPTYYPKFNGGCENGNGQLKRMLFEQSCCLERPGTLILEDLYRVVEMANSNCVPTTTTSSHDAWHSAAAPTEEMRYLFKRTYAETLEEQYRIAGREVDECIDRRTIELYVRSAVRKTLEKTALLQYQWMRFNPSIKQRIAQHIS